MDQPERLAQQAQQQCDRLTERLRTAKVTATSPKGVVRVVYNGLGDGVEMRLKPGAKQRYDSDSMAGFVTAAFIAADRAVEALRDHAFDEIKLGDDTRAGWRANPDTAAATIAECFGGTVPKQRGPAS